MIIRQNTLIRLEADEQKAELPRLGWDTEGTGRAGISFLKSPVALRLIKDGRQLDPRVSPQDKPDGSIRYDLAVTEQIGVSWEISLSGDGLTMRFGATRGLDQMVDRLELVFPLDPAVAVASVIGDRWTAEGCFCLPAILSLPDLGQMLMSCPELAGLSGRIEGSRSERWITVTLDFPIAAAESTFLLRFTPVVLPMPAGCSDENKWRAARRGWFNLIQLSCGASGGSAAVKGVWANNTLSDPVSSLVYMLGDACLLAPDLAPGVSMPAILRRTVDYWLDEKTNEAGLIAYTARGTAGLSELDTPTDASPTDNQNVMDANPAVLIGAWCYMQAVDDVPWLSRRIGDLEKLARFMISRDIDGDGLIESRQSGNSGSRPPRNPDCAWDCYCSGHKNAYVNALAHRAWLGLADLEQRLGRREQSGEFRRLAQRLKAVYLDTFFNPATGWLGFWRSRDGRLHDLYMDTPASMAISYGLIDPEQGRPMLEKYWQALAATGFHHFDLGVPLNIRPVPRSEMEEYFEFQQFLNGGCGVSNTAWLLDALWVVGMTREADLIFDAMLKRQQAGVFPNGGGFQNGFVDKMGSGAEVYDWEGRPAGYEGHLVYCWAFLHTLPLRNPVTRACVYQTPPEGRN